MKLFLVDTHTGLKVLKTKEEVVKLLTQLDDSASLKKDLAKSRVTEIEAEIVSDISGLEMVSQFRNEMARENKLNSTLGDTFSTLVLELKDFITQFGKSGPQKDNFLKKLQITPFVKASISKLLSANVDFILYEVPISLENSDDYYKLLLKIHKFRKIEETFARETYNSSGFLHSRANCVTPQRIIESFNGVKNLK